MSVGGSADISSEVERKGKKETRRQNGIFITHFVLTIFNRKYMFKDMFSAFKAKLSNRSSHFQSICKTAINNTGGFLDQRNTLNGYILRTVQPLLEPTFAEPYPVGGKEYLSLTNNNIYVLFKGWRNLETMTLENSCCSRRKGQTRQNQRYIIYEVQSPKENVNPALESHKLIDRRICV